MAAVMERDARTMNRMDEASKAVHIRLECWGRWCKANALQGALPEANGISKMMVFGLVGAGGSSAPTEMPEAVQETDRAVNCLPGPEHSAVRRYYLYWEPVEVAARHLRMEPRAFRELLKRARWRVDITLNTGLPISG